jgi:two-component sensor histidine kinase/putative methionine-R-sulfoxide reductase with GAF domain
MTTGSIYHLAAKLAADLRAAYGANGSATLAGTQPLRDAFGAFGREAGRAHLPLEDAMAAAVDALQALFDRAGGDAGDPSTMLAAGIALAALSRAYHVAEQAGEVAEAGALATAPLPWLAALHRIHRAATTNLELTDMLETSVRVVAETTGSDACAVFLYDEATDSLALRAAVGLNAAAVGAVTLRPGVGITGVAAAEGRVVAAPDAHGHPAFRPYPATGEDLYASQVSVPMLIPGGGDPDRLVGVLNILTVAHRAFAKDEIAFLQTVAGELAISIENARLYSRTDARLRRKVAELGTLQRVSHTIASTLNLADVLRLIAEQAVKLMDAEAAVIFRLPRRTNGAPADASPTVEYRVGQAGQFVDEGYRDQVIRDVVRSGSPAAVDDAYVDQTSRLFCLPLRSARETLGALCLRMRPGAELTEDELGLLQAFSDSATLAIENARLYQDAQHGLETASALLQEMHHRVRNNLQTVAALLSIHLRQEEDAPWAVHLREAVGRVQAIAAVHDLLSDESRLAGTTVDVIARHVADEAYGTLIPPGLTVAFEITPSDVTVPSRQATVLALLINELVSNAVSHGFEGRQRGKITVRGDRLDGLARVEVANDGVGVPDGFDPAESRGLGMRIVQRLVTSDLHGTFSIRSGETGTVATMTFPIAADNAAENPTEATAAMAVSDLD